MITSRLQCFTTQCLLHIEGARLQIAKHHVASQPARKHNTAGQALLQLPKEGQALLQLVTSWQRRDRGISFIAADNEKQTDGARKGQAFATVGHGEISLITADPRTAGKRSSKLLYSSP